MALTTVPGSLISSTGNITLGNLSVTGTLTHNGLTLSAGTGIDQLTTITKSLTLSTSWIDTGIKNVDLATGTYYIQLYANDVSAGGTNDNEYYTGVMSWYSGTTDSAVAVPADELHLHRSGASSEGTIGLRTYRTIAANSDHLKLQILSSTGSASNSNYIFKFRKLI